MKKRRNGELKQVYSVMGIAEAEVVKSLLASYGIPAILQSLVVQSIHPFTVNGLGEVKIMVAAEDYDMANEIIKKTLNEEK